VSPRKLPDWALGVIPEHVTLLVPNVFLRPNSQRKEANDAHAQFTHPDGGTFFLKPFLLRSGRSKAHFVFLPGLLQDHLTLLNVFHAYKGSPDANFCWQNYLNHRALMQADNVRAQLKRLMERYDLCVHSVQPRSFSYTDIWLILVTSYLRRLRATKRSITTTSGRHLPAGSLCRCVCPSSCSSMSHHTHTFSGDASRSLIGKETRAAAT
jgi:HrpA-like RNA helicase